MRFRQWIIPLVIVSLLPVQPVFALGSLNAPGSYRHTGSNARPAEEDPTGSMATPPNASEPADDSEEIINDLIPEASPADAEVPVETPSNAMPLVPFGEVLDESTIIVFDYNELKQALGQDNGFTTIYLGADIRTNASGVTVHRNKADVIIDGRPPGTSDGEQYTLTQYRSGTLGYTIQMNGSAGERTMIMRNLNIVGENYFGIVSGTDDVTIIHENIHYSGPQPVYNRSGTFLAKDSTYELRPGNVGTHELAEVRHMIFDGTVKVEAANTANSIVYLTASSPSVTVLSGANVEINTSYYFIYSTPYIPDVSIESGARLKLNTHQYGFTYGSHRIGTLTVAEDATFDLTMDATENRSALRIAGLLEARPGSWISIARTGSRGMAVEFTNAGARAVFSYPERVFLYSASGVLMRANGRGDLGIETDALNIWQRTAWPLSDGIEQLPDHIWNKKNGTLTVSAEYNYSATRALTHNLSTEDPVTSELDTTNFKLEGNQMMAFGEIYLEPEIPDDGSDYLAGNADSQALIRVDYEDDQGVAQTVTGQAEADGSYRVALAGMLAADQLVTTIANRAALYIRQHNISVEAEGGLVLAAVPEWIAFPASPVPGEPVLLSRAGGEAYGITIKDRRPGNQYWRLDAYLEQPLTAATERGMHVLSDALIYARRDGTKLTLNDQPQTVITNDETGADGGNILWQEEEGILLQVNPGEVYGGAEYQGVIHWSLVDAP